MVVVPTLLDSMERVDELVAHLEVQALGNIDPHIHFAILSDFRDAATETLPRDAEILEAARARIAALNVKHANGSADRFFLFHRLRQWNERERLWMGWERKRGKIEEFNRVLRGATDTSFILSVGDFAVLPCVRYCITLDSDTRLPRGVARELIGIITHPLNRATFDPRVGRVTDGYGVLQPRISVTFMSAAGSLFARLYSGHTGVDPYTTAVSDTYQDLFGEGIFTGKGLYDVDAFTAALDGLVPENALLSHDLFEGLHARVALVSDVELVDEYPSSVLSHARRQHRWIRGDWQILLWLSPFVPSPRGLRRNTLSIIGRWKILDNLRRSIVAPALLALLTAGWTILPGPRWFWTTMVIGVAASQLLPVVARLLVGPERAQSIPVFLGNLRRDTATAFAQIFLSLTFLAFHAFDSAHAIGVTLVRLIITRRRMLEWETAAQVEFGRSRNSLDVYLQLSPVLAFVIALLLALTNIHSLFAAAPVLLLWAVAPLVAIWLDSPPRQEEGPLTAADRLFLLQQALHVWRYFHEFGNEENHWLIPDNVEEKDMLQVLKLSPTNLGMLFNARQAAYEFGFLTLSEFASATLGTLNTYERLEKQLGHIYNWYDIETLKPIPPFTISTVDSGNLTASLYTLHSGALDLLTRPLMEIDTLTGLEQTLSDPVKRAAEAEAGAPPQGSDAAAMRAHVRFLIQQTAAPALPPPVEIDLSSASREIWFAHELSNRRSAMSIFVQNYAPWFLPQFEAIFALPQFKQAEDQRIPILQQAAVYATELDLRIAEVLPSLPSDSPLAASAASLRSLLLEAAERLKQLTMDMATIATEAERHAEAMHYDFLFVESRQLLSIGYDGAAHELHSACYDLLASEARIASFIAVAKGDIPQQSWFRLDRSHVMVNGHPALLSWTGTMFEYMMPALWMRTFPNTLLSRTLESAVIIQRDHVRNIPWGISESGYAKRDPQGRYGYQAWGIPALALKYGAEDGPVISPYSTFLALSVRRKDAIANLRRMAAMNWMGPYGFYEAADYTQSKQPELVLSWMAHHQGMCLLALTNLLKNNIVQHWFHATARVRAAELLLHEKPLSKETLKELSNRSKLQQTE